MKTQNFGLSGRSNLFFLIRRPSFALHELDFGSLENYEENRLNGTSSDAPKSAFPGFNLSSVTSYDEFFDDFDWEEDEERGYPDKEDNNRYWFTVIHKATGTRLTGFSQEADYKKGFPDSNKHYWYCVKFHEKECPPIRDWMEERDRNYLRRIQKEDPGLYQKELKNHPDHPPVKQHLEELEKEKQAKIAREREEMASEGLKPQAVALQSGQKETARTITALELTPALDSLGFFSTLRKVEILEQQNQQLAQENQELRSLLTSLQGASKEAVALNP